MKDEEALKELLKNVTRLTIIDRTGRIGSFEQWKITVDPLLQDRGRTLKIVIENEDTN
jgi:hypothetical protein